MWLLLAHYGYHPLLQEIPTDPSEPTQTKDMTIPSYISSWQHFLLQCALTGIYYSERGFFTSFYNQMHFNFRSRLGSLLLQSFQHNSWHSPLPRSFNFAELGSKLVYLAQANNLSSYLITTPHQLLTSNQPPYQVHQMESSSNSNFSCHICARPECRNTSTCLVAKQIDAIIAKNPRARQTIARRFNIRQLTSTQDPEDQSVPICSLCNFSSCTCSTSPPSSSVIPNPDNLSSDTPPSTDTSSLSTPDLLDTQDFPNAG